MSFASFFANNYCSCLSFNNPLTQYLASINDKDHASGPFFAKLSLIFQFILL